MNAKAKFFSLSLCCWMSLSTINLSAHAASNLPDAKSGNDFFEQYFDTDFFARTTDPLAEMRHLRELVFRDFPTPEKNAAAFDRWFAQKYGGSIDQVRQRQDKDHYYYDISIKGHPNEKVTAKIQNGEIYLKGVDKESNKEIQETESFVKMLPAPKDIDQKHVEIIQHPDKITMKFSKIVPS